MKEQKRILELTDFEWRLLVGCINTARSAYLDEDNPIDDVNILLIIDNSLHLIFKSMRHIIRCAALIISGKVYFTLRLAD